MEKFRSDESKFRRDTQDKQDNKLTEDVPAYVVSPDHLDEDPAIPQSEWPTHTPTGSMEKGGIAPPEYVDEPVTG